MTEKKGETDKNEKINIKNNITKPVKLNPSKIRGPLVARKKLTLDQVENI